MALFVLSLACTAFGVVFVVQRSTQPEAETSFYRQVSHVITTLHCRF